MRWLGIGKGESWRVFGWIFTHGSPPGIPGFLLTGFLAFLMGKSMLETRGLLWPWTIHFLPDVVVFASYVLALLAIYSL